MALQIIEVPLKQLKFDEIGNVRKTEREPEPGFLASIKTKGILVPLRVRQNGEGFLVVDGGKRLGALKELSKRNELAQDVVPCILSELDDTAARDLSLTSNFIRSPMHPVDEYEAFAQMQKDGMTIADICKGYGISKKEADKVLALGALAPGVRKAWRAGNLREDDASAFTIEPDHARQEAVLKKLGNNVHRYAVRRELAGDQSGVQRYMTLVGTEAYEAAGGKINKDLFASKHEESAFVSDLPLLKRLVDERLQAECDKLIADGWAWAEIDPAHVRYGFDSLNREGYKPKPTDKAKSGCFVVLDHSGKVSIEKWYIKGKAKVAGEKAKATKAAAAAPAKAGPAVLSNALKQRLESQLIHATQDALSIDSAAGKGLVVVLGKVVVSQIDPNGGWRMPSAVKDKLAAIREHLTAKSFNEAMKKRFDAKNYFSNAPKEIVLKAIEEAVNKDEASKLKNKTKAETWKFAVGNVVKTGWLPKELRTTHYIGPGSTKSAPKKKAA